MTFDLFAMFELDHHWWMTGYKHGRSGRYRICLVLDSTGQCLEMLRGVDVHAYRAGYNEGRDTRLRETEGD